MNHLKDYILLLDNWIPKYILDKTLEELPKNKFWKQHKYTDTKTLKTEQHNGDKELDICYGENLTYIQKLHDLTWKALEKYIIVDNNIYFPSLSLPAMHPKVSILTSAVNRRAISPSFSSGNRSKRISAITIPRTLSPRNSSLSLEGISNFSLPIRLECVSAQFRSSGSSNLYPSDDISSKRLGLVADGSVIF